MSFILDLVMGAIGSPFSGQMRQALAERRNTPSGALDQVLQHDTPAADRDNRLWAVDRILEPQTVPHFVEFSVRGKLSSGKQTSLPILSEDDFSYVMMPMSSWAPAPFNQDENSIIGACMVNIGSEEDSDRLVPIAKELLAMKARIWEGVMPLSERRWAELELDSPANFGDACQYLCAVINVFHYLNLPKIKADLRETYNRIWQHFDKFDKALQGLESKASPPDVSMAALWHEYIKDHYEFISNRSHRWVIEHIDRLRGPILAQLSNEMLADSLGGRDGPQFALANQIHDLFENGAQADSSIFIPMDGYKGEMLPSQDDVEVDTSSAYREEPIAFSASTNSRKADYYCRLKYLSRVETWSADNGDVGTASASKSQIRAQLRAREELRGKQPSSQAQELWVANANRHFDEGISLQWGYIGYRTCSDCTDDEWEQFKAKFNADISNWGSELKDVEAIRALCTVEWKDIRELVASGGDAVSAAKKEFAALTAEEDEQRSFRDDMFLVADKAVIDSYLDPEQNGSGHVLAIEVRDDDEEDDPNRMEESPGYSGWLRILGSLLWDDVGALLLMQADDLMTLWPLAQNDAQNIYRHPLGPTKARV